MKKILITSLAAVLLSGCAYYEGTMSQKNDANTTQKKRAVDVETDTAPNPFTQEQKPTPAQTSAQMLSPITH